MGEPPKALRMLIRKFPSLAVKVLDNCITKESVGEVDENNNNSSSHDSGKVEYKFDYTFLEDTYNYKRHVLKKEVDLTTFTDNSKEEKEKIKFAKQKAKEDAKRLKQKAKELSKENTKKNKPKIIIIKRKRILNS